MTRPVRTLARLQRLLSTEHLIALGAVGVTVFVLAQPAVLALAGLSFDHVTRGAQATLDLTPTGSLRGGRMDVVTTADPSATIHGLSGMMRPLRAQP